MRYPMLFLTALALCYQSVGPAIATDVAGPAPHPAVPMPQHPATERILNGRVIQHTVSAGLNYIQVDIGKQVVWVAAPGDTTVRNGEQVSFSSRLSMQDFHSKSLNREFPIIYFIKQLITQPVSTNSMDAPAESANRFFPSLDRPANSSTSISPSSMLPARTVAIGKQLPAASLQGLNGDDRNTIDYRGKPLLINVWASWCGPCRAEMGSLERLAKRFDGEQFNVIGISTDDVSADASNFLEQSAVSFDNFIDRKLKMERILGATTIPLTVLVSADGRVLHKVRGSREWDSQEIIEAIAQVFEFEPH